MATPNTNVTGIAIGDFLKDGSKAMTGTLRTIDSATFAITFGASNNYGIRYQSTLDGGRYDFINNFAAVASVTSSGLGLGVSGQLTAGSTSVYANRDIAWQRNAAGVWEANSGVPGIFRDVKLRNLIVSAGLIATDAAAPTVASATTIAPTKRISFVSGTAAIATITAPAPIASGGGQITLIPTGIFTTTTSGNIALASTAVVSRALIMTYDTTTGKWYPSY